MKTTTLICICFLLFNCTIQQRSETVIIDFLNDIILNEKYNDSELKEYLNFNIENKDIIKFSVSLLNKEIEDKKKIEIVSYEKFLEKEKFKNYNIKNKDIDNIYCILYDKEFLTPIIINKNGKIDSFFTGIIKNTSNIHPIILNDRKN